jgi:ribosome-associated heat shock protein Hsp15
MPVRVDKWLWSVRVYKSRTQATDACASGRVLVNDAVAKPATRVDAGDVVSVSRRDRLVIHEVVEPIEKRVSAKRAAECVVDRSPAVDRPSRGPTAVFARRDAGAGRPTKRDRREIERLRRRD